MKFKKILIALSLVFALFVPLISSAAILDNTLIVEAQDCSKGCSLNTFVKFGINVADYILGIVGALTLLMFIYGGFMWILSGGSSDKVQKGKDIIIGSVVGLLIVFSSYMIINFVSVNLLGGEFNDTITDEKKVANPGDKCKAAPYNSSCTKNTCDPNTEGTEKLDCPEGEHCCYKRIDLTAPECRAGGRCVQSQFCDVPALVEDDCRTQGEICCVKEKLDIVPEEGD